MNPMMSIFARGMMDPNSQQRALMGTERIPARVPTSHEGLMPPQMPQQPQMPTQGLGSSSKNLFDSYMSQIFNQQYTPPPIAGLYGQQPGGYMGFFGRQLPALPKPPQQSFDPSDPRSPEYMWLHGPNGPLGPNGSPGA